MSVSSFYGDNVAPIEYLNASTAYQFLFHEGEKCFWTVYSIDRSLTIPGFNLHSNQINTTFYLILHIIHSFKTKVIAEANMRSDRLDARLLAYVELK
jgi:hypothetical protein